MKRNKWTNDEVIGILEDFLFSKDGVIEDTGWNNSLLLAISQFEDFKRPIGDYAAMAYDPKTKDIVVVGPPLPR